MLILHLSDLHFGTHSRFKGEDLAKLGKAFFKDLTAARGSFAKDSPVDLVAVTGDIAESGKPTEFKEGERFLAALAGELGLDRRRFVFVPGNHDVSWPACKKVEADQEEEGFDESELRRRMDQVKLGRYEEFLRSFYGVKYLNEVALPLGRGAYLYTFPDLHLSVAALNTCEKESHRRADHVGFLSREQAEALIGEWRSSEESGWLKIVTLHHNPVVTVPSNIAPWRKEIEGKGLASDLAARYESDVVGFEGREHLKAIVEDTHVQLVLHGHHHARDEQSWDWRRGAKGRAAVLSSGSLTLTADKLPEDEPLSLRLIELAIGQKEIRGRSLIYDPRSRTESVLRRGSFVSDPTEPNGYRQHLDLPLGFEPPQKIPKVPKKNVSVNPAAFIRSYRMSLGASFVRWDLTPVGIPQTRGIGKPIEARLDEMYQPLRLAEGFNIDDTEQGEPINPGALLNRRRSLAIRGAAGTGKTTWMRWTFRRLLREERALPLMLVVRDLARYWQSPGCRGSARSLVSFLDTWAAEHMGTGWEGGLQKILEASSSLRLSVLIDGWGEAHKLGGGGPRPIILVDGWDEAGKLGEELREKLVGLLAKYPRMLAVVTSRPYGEGKPSSAEGFEVLDIQPLSDLEIQKFTYRFFHQCYGEDEVAVDREAEGFWRALERSPEPRVLARTALLLTMMLLIGRSRTLPDKRHLLYEACIDNLLTALPDRRAEDGALLLREQWRPDDNEERKRVVAGLAYALQDKDYRKSGRSPIVRDWEGMAAFLPSEWDTEQKRGFLAWLAGPAGLLDDRSDGTLAFPHLSFQEYLTAWHLNAKFEGTEERIREFERKQDLNWWETLRLWAALIEKSSPIRLDPVLASIMSSGPMGLSLVGTILADGLGTARHFERWKALWKEELMRRSIPEANRCARSWAASRQEARKEALATALCDHITSANWLEGIRLMEYLHEAAMPRTSAASKSLVNRCIIKVIAEGSASSDHSIAAGRVLCSGPSLWPVDPLEVGLLQAWPGARRILGLRLQSAVALGISRVGIQQLVRFFSQQAIEVDFAGDFAGDFARGFARDFAGSLTTVLTLGSASDLARDLACDFSRYLAGGFARIARNSSADLSRDLAGYFSHYFVRYFARDFPSDFAQELAREFVHFLAHSTMHNSTKDYLGLGHFLDEEEDLSKVEDLVLIEAMSFGRVGARALLAHARTHTAETRVLSTACQLSLHPSHNDYALDAALARYASDLDPLWPALARHLARRATPKDRALLTDLAQHPEKREPPLSWGLQFIVRGDVLFDDGSVVTLDELCDEAGVPRLPYLEDLPDELEVDWDEPKGS